MSPLRVGAVRAPKIQRESAPPRPETGKARRIAGLSAAAVMIVGVGAASALFVDYLADRALARGTDPVVVKPVVAKAAEPAEEVKVASIVPETTTDALPAGEAIQPQAEPIEPALPNAAAIAKVAAAVGPEHAIETPTDDPTASPIVHVENLGGGEDSALDVAALQPDEAIDEGSDQTETAAISPDEMEAAPAPKPKKVKGKSVEAKAPVAKSGAKAATRDTEVASLPGVDVGGLAGHPSDEDDSGSSTVKTATKPAMPKGGGVAGGSARVTQAVNMRSSPKKGASVLGVVPASTTVKVMSCDGWCQISYNGRTGWVYKSFLAASKPQKQDAASATPRKVSSSRL